MAARPSCNTMYAASPAQATSIEREIVHAQQDRVAWWRLQSRGDRDHGCGFRHVARDLSVHGPDRSAMARVRSPTQVCRERPRGAPTDLASTKTGSLTREVPQASEPIQRRTRPPRPSVRAHARSGSGPRRVLTVNTAQYAHLTPVKETHDEIHAPASEAVMRSFARTSPGEDAGQRRRGASPQYLNCGVPADSDVSFQ
jgi:hypothetical protein